MSTWLGPAISLACGLLAGAIARRKKLSGSDIGLVALLGVVGLGLVFFLPLKPRTICAQCSVCDAAQILPRGTIEAVCSNCGFAIDTEARVPVPIGVGKPPGWYMCENRYRWWDGARWREWCQGQELNN